MGASAMKMFRRLAYPFALAVVCHALSGCATSPWIAYAARVDPANPKRYLRSAAVTDAVDVYRAGRPIFADQVLWLGDEIETGADSVAVIRFPDGNKVIINSRTRVRLGSLDVLFGRVFARIKGLFAVESQNIVAGVEGTEFEFTVAHDKAVSITVLDGRVICTAKTGGWPPVRMGSGTKMVSAHPHRMTPRVAIAAPAELEEIRSWVQRVEEVAPSPPQPSPWDWPLGIHPQPTPTDPRLPDIRQPPTPPRPILPRIRSQPKPPGSRG